MNYVKNPFHLLLNLVIFTIPQIIAIGHFGLEVFAIADGNPETAWRNQYTSNSYFIIDFYYMNFLITGYTITKDCNTLPPLVILGSNDNITWKEIDKQIEMGTDQSFSYFPIRNHMNSFRFIKFSVFNNDGYIHISELELFGILNYMPTCQKNLFFRYLSCLSMIFLSFS